MIEAAIDEVFIARIVRQSYLLEEDILDLDSLNLGQNTLKVFYHLAQVFFRPALLRV